jgi:hypothetical protein
VLLSAARGRRRVVELGTGTAWTAISLALADQRRGVFGPAHRGWHGNSPEDHRRRWSDYDWSGYGEEWNASLDWKRALIGDVLERWIPAGVVVLEIGPGAGRWSQALAGALRAWCSWM